MSDLRIVNAPHCSGVYYILNKRTERIYVGRSEHIGERWVDHKRLLRSGWHHNQLLQADWKAYGTMAFEWGVLAGERVYDDPWNERTHERLFYGKRRKPLYTELEATFIRAYQAHDPRFGYNLTAKQQRNLMEALYGKRH